MNKNEEVLLQLLKLSLFGLPAEFPDDTDWDGVLKEAKDQMVVSLISSAVPDSESQRLKVPSAMSKAHFMRALYEQTKLIKLLDGEEIPFVIIKGTAAAMYYPKPVYRTMGDIDILVAKEYFDSAFELLKANGYEFKHSSEDNRDFAFAKDKVLFELHRRYSDQKNDIEEYLMNGLKNRREVTIYDNSFPALPETENGIVLLDHIRHHIFGGLGIRQIIDFMMFLNSVPDDEYFEKEFLPLCKSVKLDTLCLVVTKMCKKYFGLQKCVSLCETAEDDICDELMNLLLSKGNFGRKSRYVYRPMRELTVEIRENGIFKTLQNAGVENCEIFKKHRILRPFAWIYQLFRYITRGIKAFFVGEKLTDDIAVGKQQSAFFERLGLK